MLVLLCETYAGISCEKRQGTMSKMSSMIKMMNRQIIKRYGCIINRFRFSTQLDSYVISYPKSGRTWLKALIGKYLSLKYELSEDLVLSPKDLTQNSGLPTLFFSHAGTGLGADEDPDSDLLYERHKKPYRNVILLGREIKDTLVSSYFHATKRSRVFEGSISEYIRTDRFGARRILEFYELWLQTQDRAERFMFLRYEDLHQDPKVSLIKVLEFIGETEINEDIVNQSVDYCCFENLRRLEVQNRFQKSALRVTSPEDIESYKTRKGKVGGYTDYLSEEDQAFVDELVKKRNWDFEKFA